jgi:hypothetical protein
MTSKKPSDCWRQSTDTQFGRNHRFGNLGLPEPDARFDTLFQRLSDDLAVLEREGVKPPLIVLSGDIAEWGKKQEFEDACEFLVKLSERLMVPRRHVVIVPGNHDINRKLCEAYFAESARAMTGSQSRPTRLNGSTIAGCSRSFTEMRRTSFSPSKSHGVSGNWKS